MTTTRLLLAATIFNSLATIIVVVSGIISINRLSMAIDILEKAAHG